MKKIIGFIVILFVLFAGLSAYGQTSKTIKFATEATYPPFESVDAEGKIQGFDVDIMHALCTQMKVHCTITNQPWDSLIPSLQMGKFDALIGAMAITKAREKVVNFTQPYYDNTASLVAKKSKHLQLTAQSLQAKTIGVQEGTTFGHYWRVKFSKQITIKPYASI